MVCGEKQIVQYEDNQIGSNTVLLLVLSPVLTSLHRIYAASYQPPEESLASTDKILCFEAACSSCITIRWPLAVKCRYPASSPSCVASIVPPCCFPLRQLLCAAASHHAAVRQSQWYCINRPSDSKEIYMIMLLGVGGHFEVVVMPT